MKNPTFIRKPYMHFLKIFLFLFIIATASSCKTCNCPAYSYQKNTNPIGRTIYMNKTPAANKYSFPDSLNFSSPILDFEAKSI
jgi:hypothetical protein